MKDGISVEQIIASYDDAAPLTEASTIPAPWYVDARIAELERQTVFSRTWQVMGRVDQVEKPGQFVTATVAGEPLVAVRGNDGVLRAFYNVCRHHAAAVTVGDTLYVIGGFTSTGFEPKAEVFALKVQGTWQRVAALPEARGALAAAVVDNRILVVFW